MAGATSGKIFAIADVNKLMSEYQYSVRSSPYLKNTRVGDDATVELTVVETVLRCLMLYCSKMTSESTTYDEIHGTRTLALGNAVVVI